MKNKKILLPVVVFEKCADLRTSRERPTFPGKDSETIAKEPVVKKMYLDLEYIATLGIRQWDNKHAGKNEKWTVLFDKLKEGENILIALDIDSVVEKFKALGIIEVVS